MRQRRRKHHGRRMWVWRVTMYRSADGEQWEIAARKKVMLARPFDLRGRKTT